MESLIQNGEDWMLPLLKFRDLLAKTTEPEQKDIYRNFKRRNGKVTYQYAKEGEDIATERKHIPGPYWLKYRKAWLKELLELNKELSQQGHNISLITEPELHAIRQQWLRDPNEPDWADELPKIYREVYDGDLAWIIDDQSRFDVYDASLLCEIAEEYDASPEMVMKLIELEISMEGISRRHGVFDKIGSILKQDWGSLESIEQSQKALQKRHERDIHQVDISEIEIELKKVQDQLSKIETQILGDTKAPVNDN
jgi:DNA sulfur modification protein DndC